MHFFLCILCINKSYTKKKERKEGRNERTNEGTRAPAFHLFAFFQPRVQAWVLVSVISYSGTLWLISPWWPKVKKQSQSNEKTYYKMPDSVQVLIKATLLNIALGVLASMTAFRPPKQVPRVLASV